MYKFLTDRKEIAKAINIDETPVVKMDITNSMKGYENCYEGDKVVVLDKNGYDIRCTVKMFSDGLNENLHHAPQLYKTIELMPETICLDNSFGYSDVVEMYEWRKAIRIKEGEEVIVMFEDNVNKVCYLRRMKVGRVRKWVYPTATLEDVE